MIEARKDTVGSWKPGPKPNVVDTCVKTRKSTPRKVSALPQANHLVPAVPAGDACAPANPGNDIPLPTIFAAGISREANSGNWLVRALRAVWHGLGKGLRSHQPKKRLRVCETVSLGEKRFVAVIQVDGEQFLVGGSSSSISTLAHLDRPREFSEVFANRYQQDCSQA